jgi:hypothetical protein
MAKVSYIQISPELAPTYFKGLRSADRFQYSRVVRNTNLLSRTLRKAIPQRSLMPVCSPIWAAQSADQKLAWKNAAAESGLTAWQLFLKDYALRQTYGLPGLATPSLLHQGAVGNLHIESPASNLKIRQDHPGSYYVSRKITGTRSMYSPVLIQEKFSLPLTLTVNYSSNLEAAGPNPSAKLYARIWYAYQGRDLYYDLSIDFDLAHDWVQRTAQCDSLISYVIGYTLFFELTDVVGDLYFDNLFATHNGFNWCRDSHCDQIAQGFTKAFYQVPSHWVAESAPVGADYDSIYKDF